MTVADNLRKICSAARPAIEAALDAAEELSEIREAASEQGLDWSQLKALLKAHIQDNRDGGERVLKLMTKADNAATYAAMLDFDSFGHIVTEKLKTPPQSNVSRENQLAAGRNPAPHTSGDEAGALTPASPIPEPDPSLDIRNMPFHRGASS